MPARPRVPAAAAATILLAALAAVAAGCSAGVLHGLDEGAANEALAALERAGIAAEKKADDGAPAAGGRGRFSLRVARGDAARALDVLRVQGLPRGQRHGFAEVYGQASLIPTASEERARYVEALAGEIERTLETADGVVSARVHLVLEETDPLALEGKPRTAARAAVLLKTARGQTPPPLPEADVQKLVAGSVPGLDTKAVAVVMTAAPESTEPDLGPLASVGPLRVTPSSRTLLVTALAVALALIAGLSALLLITLRRRPAADAAAEPRTL